MTEASGYYAVVEKFMSTRVRTVCDRIMTGWMCRYGEQTQYWKQNRAQCQKLKKGKAVQ